MGTFFEFESNLSKKDLSSYPVLCIWTFEFFEHFSAIFLEFDNSNRKRILSNFSHLNFNHSRCIFRRFTIFLIP